MDSSIALQSSIGLRGGLKQYSDTYYSTVMRRRRGEWTLRFGVLAAIIKDQGIPFESTLFSELAKLLGSKRLRITVLLVLRTAQWEEFTNSPRK